MPSRTVSILLVEDDEVDQKGLKRAFKERRIANPIHVARDGLEALEVLRGDNGRSPLPRPYLILLDLDMPRMNGIEFLKEIRGDATLKDSVVFVLTTSGEDKERTEAYKLNVAGYMVKSNAGSTFTDAVTMLDHYWKVVELP